MSSDTRGIGHGPDKPGGHDQEAEVEEYQRSLDATSENGTDREEDSRSGEAAEWADRHPRAAGAVGGPGDESANDPVTPGSRTSLSKRRGSATLNSYSMSRVPSIKRSRCINHRSESGSRNRVGIGSVSARCDRCNTPTDPRRMSAS